MPSSECPCGSGSAFTSCCGPYLAGDASAPTAVALMRSRYCAYVSGDEAYLLDTWHPSTRPDVLNLDSGQTPTWIGLKVVAGHGGGSADTEGSVEFVARYKINGKAHRMRETSRFVKDQGRWFYLDGDVDSQR